MSRSKSCSGIFNQIWSDENFDKDETFDQLLAAAVLSKDLADSENQKVGDHFPHTDLRFFTHIEVSHITHTGEVWPCAFEIFA